MRAWATTPASTVRTSLRQTLFGIKGKADKGVEPKGLENAKMKKRKKENKKEQRKSKGMKGELKEY